MRASTSSERRGLGPVPPTAAVRGQRLLRVIERRVEATAPAEVVTGGEASVVVRCTPARLALALSRSVEGFLTVEAGPGAGPRVYACEDEGWRLVAERLWWSADPETTEADLRRLGDLHIAACPDDEDGAPPAYALLDARSALVALVLPPGHARFSSMSVVRVVRAMILLALREAGWGYLHAACVSIGAGGGGATAGPGTGIALTGAKFAGKTTLALHLLAADAGWQLVSNDKLAVRVTPDGVRGRGFPIRMGIRAGSLQSLGRRTEAALRQAARGGAGRDAGPEGAALGPERIHVRPQDVAVHFATTVVPEASVRLIVEPHHNPRATRPRLVRLDRREALHLLATQYLPDLTAVAERQSFLEALRPGGRLPAQEISALAQQLVEAVPVYRLHHDRRANRHAVALLDAVAGSAGCDTAVPVGA